MTEENSTLTPDSELVSRKRKRSRAFLKGYIIVSTLLILIFWIIPEIKNELLNVSRVKAISNSKQLGIALFYFSDEYGNYPGPKTVDLINAKYPNHSFDLSGNSSNAIFRQLFAAEITESEILFYAKTRDAIKPDNNISHGEALKKGEVGFAYISGLSSKDNPSTPITLTPLIPGTTKFDPKPYGGKAIIGQLDNSARTYDINKDGHVYDKDGDILSPNHPIWNGKTPTIHYPE